MRFRTALGLVVLACGSATLASRAYAQYAPTESELTVTATTVSPGGSVTISGDGFCPNSPVTVTAVPSDGGAARTVDSFATDAAGKFSRSVSLEGLPPDGYALQASGTDRDCIRTRVLGVQIAVEQRRPRAMPSASGSPPWQLLGVLVLVVATAVLLLLAARRRRKAGQQASAPGAEPNEPPQ
jgi:hypothetical protein